MKAYLLVGCDGIENETILGVYEDEEMATDEETKLREKQLAYAKIVKKCILNDGSYEDVPGMAIYDSYFTEEYDLIPKVKKEREVLSTNL